MASEPQPAGAGRMGDVHAPEAEHAVTAATPHHHVPYFLIFGVLVVLTIVTVLVARVNLGAAGNLMVALAIAMAKASCVAVYFMHLKFEGKLISIILFVPLGLCVLLCVALIPDIVHGLVWDTMTPLPGEDQEVAG